MATIVYRGTKEQAKAAIVATIGRLTGRAPDPEGYAKSVFLAVGVAALSDIKADFVRKASGATGEDGVAWQRQTPEYLAYRRRFGRGEKTALKRAAGLGRSHHLAPGGKDGLLNARQLQRWRQVYARTAARLMVSMGADEAKRIAAGHAWNVIKSEGAQTKLSVYGSRQVEILRDTGRLLNSLSPGMLDSAGRYSKPTGPGGSDQIMQTLADGVIVGTNVAYASFHQRGKGRAHRPFLPEPVPTAWRARWITLAGQAISAAIGLAIREAN